MLIESTLGLLAASLAGAGFYLWPNLQRVVQTHALRRFCGRTRSLVLTYDDGPGPHLTVQLLELLAKHRAKATFFLLGSRAECRPDLVDQIVASGHEVGCHGYWHRNALKTWPWRAVADIQAGYKTLARWVPADGVFRPPNGKLSLATWVALRRRGAPIGWWTVDSGDTREVLPDPDVIVDAIQQAGGGVVLMHDFDRIGPSSAERVAFVLDTTERLLKLARREGANVRPLGGLVDDRDDTEDKHDGAA